MEKTAPAAARRSLAFVGINAGLALHPADSRGAQVPGEPASCFATFWQADWSRWGAGSALLVATLQGWRSYGTNEALAKTLATELTRYFPEAARFDEFTVEVDPATGFRATGHKAELAISAVLDRRQFTAPSFQLGEGSAALSNVYLPCSTGRLAEFGVEWPGTPAVYPGPLGPSSSAFIALAESWVL